MKTKSLQFLLGGVALLLLVSLFACDKEKKNEPQGTKIESISFKQENYIVELSQTEGVKLREELVIAPAAITDTCIVKWALTNPDVASISQDGVITPKKVGETLVTATVQDKSAQCKFKVEKEIIHVESVKVIPEEFSEDAKVGSLKKLYAIVSPDNATDKTVTWTSSNTDVATVGISGIITCVGAGEATITATCDGKSGSCNVVYKKIRVSSITVKPSSSIMSVNVGSTKQIYALIEPSDATDKTVTWTSSNNAVATVSSTGLVTCRGVGNAMITASCDGRSGTCVIVYNPIEVQSVTMSRTSATLLSVGMSGGRDIGILSLDATVTPSNATYPTVTWESSNSSVASVDKYGNVIAKAEGEATITATAGKKSATCEVTVKPAAYIKDRENNMYLTVKIGSQWWMADNLRCKTYDSDSERAGYTLSTSRTTSYAPYYEDASNKDHWEVYGPVYLSDEQVAELGYLYSWAAAVGLESESAAKSQTSSFVSRCQGICPNGWHLPKYDEWQTLTSYIGDDAGSKLKTTSGWYRGNGTDDYFFAVLPAGSAAGTNVQSVGDVSYFWMADPFTAEKAWAVKFDEYSLPTMTSYGKDFARSIRCVKN